MFHVRLKTSVPSIIVIYTYISGTNTKWNAQPCYYFYSVQPKTNKIYWFFFCSVFQQTRGSQYVPINCIRPSPILPTPFPCCRPDCHVEYDTRFMDYGLSRRCTAGFVNWYGSFAGSGSGGIYTKRLFAINNVPQKVNTLAWSKIQDLDC